MANIYNVSEQSFAAENVDYGETNYVNDIQVDWDNPKNAKSLVVALRGLVTLINKGIDDPGHPIGLLGEVINTVADTIYLMVGTEGIVKNQNSSGTITTAAGVVSHMNQNEGTIDTLNLYEATVSNNNGTITNLQGFHFPDLSSVSGITNKRCFYNEDSGAALINNGTTYLDGVLRVGTYAVSGVPSASALSGYWIHTTDGWAGNPGPAFSDGTNWLRFDTGAAIAAA